MGQPGARGQLTGEAAGNDGALIMPPELAALVDRLAEGRITVTSIVEGELSRAEAFRWLMADDSISVEQLAEWEVSLDDLVRARRRELLGDRVDVYEARLAEYLAAGSMGTTDAEIAAYRAVTTPARAATTEPAATPAQSQQRLGAGLLNLRGARDSAGLPAEQDLPLPDALRPGDDQGASAVADQVDGEATDPGSRDEAPEPPDGMIDRLAAGGITIASIVDGTVSRDQAFTWLAADGSIRPAELARLDELVSARRLELLGDWVGAYQDRLAEYLAATDVHESAAQAAAFRDIMAAKQALDPTGPASHNPQDVAGAAASEASSAAVERQHDGDNLLELLAAPQPAATISGQVPGTPEPDAARTPQRDGDTAASTVEAATSPAAEPAQPGPRFRPSGQHDLAPSTPVQRARANIAALRVLADLKASGSPVAPDQQRVLARWGGWGSCPQIFDEHNAQWAPMRAELRQLLSADEYRAAARTTINAHYTDAAFVAEIWSAMRHLGFTGGQVLEPGSGAGVFLGLAPEAAQMTGVELDPTTAHISQLIYPHARVLNESFADTRAPAASFDAAIGNVPFGDVVLHDPRHNPHKLSIHNHFLVKALDLVKPGGLLAMVTSAYTMDAQNPATRRLLADQADLLGAIRLPSRAHRSAAGTDALTDILLLRRREPGQDPQPVDWERSVKVQVGEHELRINEYFLSHPGNVLGDLITGDGLYRAAELAVRGPVGADLIAPLRTTLQRVTDSARTRSLTFAPAESAPAAAPVMLVGTRGRPEGHIQATAGGGFDVVHSGVVVTHEVPARQAAELRSLLELRDITMALLTAEAATLDDTDEIAELRQRLGHRYDAYVNLYGPINRFTVRNTGRADPHTGEAKTARIRPPQGRFREDTYAAAVYALEHFDGETQTARKVDLFTHRVIAPRVQPQGADTPADALAITMDIHGHVDLDHVGDLLGVDASEARTLLGDLVYPDPAADGKLVPAADYLSGNVRIKLAQAELAADTDPAYEANADALRKVIPEDIQPVDIHAALGAVWIDAAHVQRFLQEILDDTSVRVTHPGGSIWVVEGGDRGGVQSRQVWGTDRMPAVKIAAAVLEQRTINVYDVIDTPHGERRILNAEATAAAREKGRELNERFGEWVWEDPARADDLVRAYNNAFNGLVLRNYDNPRLSLPGLVASFAEPGGLRPHQLAAVARIIAEPAVLLAHEVGAGKTLEMAVGAMELRRLGLARVSWIS